MASPPALFPCNAACSSCRTELRKSTVYLSSTYQAGNASHHVPECVSILSLLHGHVASSSNFFFLLVTLRGRSRLMALDLSVTCSASERKHMKGNTRRQESLRRRQPTVPSVTTSLSFFISFFLTEQCESVRMKA